MKDISPTCSRTVVHKTTRDWLPASFEDLMSELNALHQLNNETNLIIYRGHRDRAWLLDTTFVRACKTYLFGLKETDRLSDRLVGSVNLHLALLNLFLFKFGILVKPSQELYDLEKTRSIDPWFELMKRIQQHPEEGQDGPFCLKGTNILDWTASPDVALYFANEKRAAEGAIYICDATATGNTLQTISVEAILDKMHEEGNAGNALGGPLMFHPKHQIANQRAKNQQAMYFAQMDLRVDMERIWRLQESELANGTIIIKLILPAGTELQVAEYLSNKGITLDFLYPAEPCNQR